MNNFLSVLYPILSVLITGTLVPLAAKFILSKISAENLAKDLKTGGLIWDALEEDGRLGKLKDTKLASFIDSMRARTKLNDADILLINKSIAGGVNAGKEVIAEVAKEVTPIVVAPKFVDGAGNEYVRKEPTVI